MDKFELKDKLIGLIEDIDKNIVNIMSPSCKDDETGEIRAEIYTCIREAQEKLRGMMYNIY